jgi:tetrahydromethanopterin S-methyltransferase subunit C
LEFGGIGGTIGNEGKNGRSMNWKSRLKAIGIGTILAAVGYLRIRGGTLFVIHWTGQPMFSFGLIAAGLVAIASAAIPQRLISKITTVGKR